MTFIITAKRFIGSAIVSVKENKETKVKKNVTKILA